MTTRRNGEFSCQFAPQALETITQYSDVTHRHICIECLDSGEKIEEDVDVVVSARGFLNDIQWPSIPGMENFKGEKMHSAQWNDKYRIPQPRSPGSL